MQAKLSVLQQFTDMTLSGRFSLRQLAVIAALLTLSGCTPNCDGLVGLWRTEYNGETLSFEIRADQSLTTTASGEITGGSWQCLATGSALLKDKKSAPMNALLIDASTIKLPVSAATPGLPEIFLKRVDQQ